MAAGMENVSWFFGQMLFVGAAGALLVHFIHRVSKVCKGGRRFSLVALVVVGDGKGNVGLGMGKSTEVPLAIRKAIDDAKKNMFTVPVTESGSIPHEVIGRFGAGCVLVKPAIEGTGVIAGGPVRPLFELAGIRNVLSKSLGTPNALNAIKAAAHGLRQLSSPAETANRRGDLDTGEAENMSEMFKGCSALEELKLNGTGWDTSKVTNFAGIFSGCKALKELDISTWSTEKVAPGGTLKMFDGVPRLQKLVVSYKVNLKKAGIEKLFGKHWMLISS